MPITVIYDIGGTITRAVVSPEGSAVGHLQARPGERAKAIEASDFQVDAQKGSVLEQIEDLTKNFCIDTKSPDGKFMKKILDEVEG